MLALLPLTALLLVGLYTYWSSSYGCSGCGKCDVTEHEGE